MIRSPYILALAIFSAFVILCTPLHSAKAHDTGEPHSHAGETNEPSRTELRREMRKHETRQRQQAENRRQSRQNSTGSTAPNAQRNTGNTDGSGTMIYRGRQNESRTGSKLWNSY